MSFETVDAGGKADEFTKTFAEQVVDLATQEQMRFAWVMVHLLDVEGNRFDPKIELLESPPIVVNPKFIERFKTFKDYQEEARKYHSFFVKPITLDGKVPQKSGPIHGLWCNMMLLDPSEKKENFDLVGFPISCSHVIGMCNLEKDLNWYFYSKGFESYEKMKEAWNEKKKREEERRLNN